MLYASQAHPAHGLPVSLPHLQRPVVTTAVSRALDSAAAWPSPKQGPAASSLKPRSVLSCTQAGWKPRGAGLSTLCEPVCWDRTGCCRTWQNKGRPSPRLWGGGVGWRARLTAGTSSNAWRQELNSGARKKVHWQGKLHFQKKCEMALGSSMKKFPKFNPLS